MFGEEENEEGETDRQTDAQTHKQTYTGLVVTGESFYKHMIVVGKIGTVSGETYSLTENLQSHLQSDRVDEVFIKHSIFNICIIREPRISVLRSLDIQ
jgi:hypothetical protein